MRILLCYFSFLMVNLAFTQNDSRIEIYIERDTILSKEVYKGIDSIIVRSYDGIVPKLYFDSITFFAYEIGNNSLCKLLNELGKSAKCKSIIYSGFEKNKKLIIKPKTDTLILEISSLRKKLPVLRLDISSEIQTLILNGIKIDAKLLSELNNIKDFSYLEIANSCKIKISLKKINKMKLKYKVVYR